MYLKKGWVLGDRLWGWKPHTSRR